MNKKKIYNILLGLGIATGIYLLASRIYRKYKSMSKSLQDGELYIQELLDQLEVVTNDGSVIESYDIPETNMAFPLQIDDGCIDGIPGGCEEYQNVQKLQVVLLYQISSLPFNLDADGKFGNKTEEAVIQYLNTLGASYLQQNGYTFDFVSVDNQNIADLSGINYITQELYNNDILPQYEAIVG